MPHIIIKERGDRTGPIKLTLGGSSKVLSREKKVEVTEEELEILQNSYEANQIFVLPEVDNGSPDRAERPELDSGGHEASPRTSRKQR